MNHKGHQAHKDLRITGFKPISVFSFVDFVRSEVQNQLKTATTQSLMKEFGMRLSKMVLSILAISLFGVFPVLAQSTYHPASLPDLRTILPPAGTDPNAPLPMKMPVSPGQTSAAQPDLDTFVLPSTKPTPTLADPAAGAAALPLLSSVPTGVSTDKDAPPSTIFYSGQAQPYVGDVSANSQVSSLDAIDEMSAKALKNFLQGVAAFRTLPGNPQNDSSLRKILDMGCQLSKILRLRAFPVLPRFQARFDESVLRNRSYESFEYRQFGAFQTRLDGWVKPGALNVLVDLKFTARGHWYVTVKGVITRIGATTGHVALEGSDAYGHQWHLKVEMKDLLLRDDGFPSGGWIQFSGWDLDGRNMMFSVRFPCQVLPAPIRPKNVHMNPSPLQTP